MKSRGEGWEAFEMLVLNGLVFPNERDKGGPMSDSGTSLSHILPYRFKMSF
jgi:hypothetical protein